MGVGAGTGFGVVGGAELLARLTDKEVVGVGITTSASAPVVVLVEAEDVVAATVVLLDVGMCPGLPLGWLLDAMRDELIETVEG